MNIESIVYKRFVDLVGAIAYFPNETPPIGWLVCDGSSLNINDYQDLYTCIGNTYNGSSQASGTFNIPDLRGEFIRCLDNGRGIDSGRTLQNDYQQERIKTHKHWISYAPQDDHNQGGTTGNSQRFGLVADERAGYYSADDRNYAYGIFTRDDPGYNINNEVIPYNLALLVCIKY